MNEYQFAEFFEINHGEHVVVAIRVIGRPQFQALRQQHREVRRLGDRKIARIYGNPLLGGKHPLHLLRLPPPKLASLGLLRGHEPVERVALHLQNHRDHVDRHHPEVPADPLQFRGEEHVLAEVGEQRVGDGLVQNPGDFGQEGGVEDALVPQGDQQLGVLDHLEALVGDEAAVGGGDGGEVEEEEGHGVGLAEEEGGEAGRGGGVGGRIGVAPVGGESGVEDVDGEGDAAVVEVVGENGVEEGGGEDRERGGIGGFHRFAGRLGDSKGGNLISRWMHWLISSLECDTR